ncbi:winged helix-turn-helix transcriptional regulator [Rhodobacteraceae bacterium NNCM2]|nr:winged helix-turn-helix transcriptional regulator [Coraliihabitans acroporae]
MKDGPDIARVANLIGDPGRANMLTALMGGKAITARELAEEAGITASTASSHLAKLEAGGLIEHKRQGRHRYYALASPDVADVLEALMGLAGRSGHTRVRTGPRDPAMREARICYDHLAGERGVLLHDAMVRRGSLIETGDELAISETGKAFFADFGLDLDRMAAKRRKMCRPCLDWSQRRMHLGGALGAAILDEITGRGWARRMPDSRVISFSRTGAEAFDEAFGLTTPR